MDTGAVFITPDRGGREVPGKEGSGSFRKDNATYWYLSGQDYNGGMGENIAIYRPPNGLWAIQGYTKFYFGGP